MSQRSTCLFGSCRGTDEMRDATRFQDPCYQVGRFGPVIARHEIPLLYETRSLSGSMQRLEDAGRRRRRDQGSRFHFMLSPLGTLPRFSDQDTLCSDELRIELGLAVFKQHFDDFSQIGVQLVERRCLRVRTGETGHISNEQPCIRITFNDCCELSRHC